VLAWAVAGWDDHRQRGRLDPPAAVSDATSTYRINNDSVAEFIRRLLPAQPATAS